MLTIYFAALLNFIPQDNSRVESIYHSPIERLNIFIKPSTVMADSVAVYNDRHEFVYGKKVEYTSHNDFTLSIIRGGISEVHSFKTFKNKAPLSTYAVDRVDKGVDYSLITYKVIYQP
jgi:hypothetical protein